LRFQFPYAEKHSKRPDPPALCHATVRAAVAAAHRLEPSLPLLAGGKSFGGRMTSQAQAKTPLPHVVGLIFFGFPLHPPKQPSMDRSTHLFQVQIPMLFLQGTRDELAELPLVTSLAEQLGERAALTQLEDADHSFHVPKRAGRTEDRQPDQRDNDDSAAAPRCGFFVIIVVSVIFSVGAIAPAVLRRRDKGEGLTRRRRRLLIARRISPRMLSRFRARSVEGRRRRQTLPGDRTLVLVILVERPSCGLLRPVVAVPLVFVDRGPIKFRCRCGLILVRLGGLTTPLLVALANKARQLSQRIAQAITLGRLIIARRHVATVRTETAIRHEICPDQPFASTAVTTCRKSRRLYRISSGASTPSSASPEASTATTPCTRTSRATVMCRSFCIMKRKCGDALPSVQRA